MAWLAARLLLPVYLAATFLSVAGVATALAQQDTGGQPALLTADEMHFDDALGVATAKGNVEVSQGERVLFADTVTYNQRDDIVSASGNVVLLEPTGEVMFAEFAELTDDMREGFLRGFRMLLEDDSRLAAVSAQRRSGNETQLNKAAYSPCINCIGPDGEPFWRIRARRVVHNKQEQAVIYRDATVEMLGIPIAYTPYLSHPDPTVERRSGFLTPTYGTSSQFGAFTSVPYFWAISRDKDMTIEPVLYAEQNPLLTAEYRQQTGNGEIRADFSAIRDASDSNRTRYRGHADITTEFAIDETWRSGTDIRVASDDTYLSRYGFRGSSSLTNRAYVEGFGSRSYAVAEGYYFQGLRSSDDQEEIPIVLPKLNYNYVSLPSSLGTYHSIAANFQALTREVGANSQRFSVKTGWHLPHISSAGVVTNLSATLQADAYNVSDVSTNTGREDGLTGRLFPQASLEMRYPLVRRFGSTGTLVEPIGAFVVAPNGGNPDRIPNEDSLDVELDETNLFSPNRYPGIDRVEGGQRVVYGLRSGLYGSQGGSTTLFLGQSYRLRKDSDFDINTGLQEQLSDIVGRFSLSPNKYWDFLYKTRIDVDGPTPKRNELTTTIGPRAFKANLTYVYFAESGDFDEREEITAGFTSDLTERWSWRARTRRDMTSDGGTRFWETSLLYKCDCFDFSLNFRRNFTRDRDVPASDTLFFRINFKSLGGFGQNLQ